MSMTYRKSAARSPPATRRGRQPTMPAGCNWAEGSTSWRCSMLSEHWPVPNFPWPNCKPASPTIRLRYFWRWAVAGSNPLRPAKPRRVPNRVPFGAELRFRCGGYLEMRNSTPTSETEAAAARRADDYRTRAKLAEDWSAKTADAELRQSWLRIAEEYRLLAR